MRTGSHYACPIMLCAMFLIVLSMQVQASALKRKAEDILEPQSTDLEVESSLDVHRALFGADDDEEQVPASTTSILDTTPVLLAAEQAELTTQSTGTTNIDVEEEDSEGDDN